VVYRPPARVLTVLWLRAKVLIHALWRTAAMLPYAKGSQTRQPKACFAAAEGGVLLRVDVEDLPWMARLLAGLGMPFVVHRPRELCEVVRAYARTLASSAGRSEA
jgi:predicted DNA-binding transcriptional regulator YafY